MQEPVKGHISTAYIVANTSDNTHNMGFSENSEYSYFTIY